MQAAEPRLNLRLATFSADVTVPPGHGLVLLGADWVPASYRTLITQGWVHYFDYNWTREHHKAEPLSFGTVRSRLWQVLEAGHYDVKLSRDDRHRIKCWIDLNCPLWPDYRQRTLRPGPPAATAQAGK